MKKLYLITDNFPFGKGEKSFIEPELKYLVQKFDVTIISTSTEDNQTTDLNKDIDLLHYKFDVNYFNVFKYTLKALFNKAMINEIKEIISIREKIFYRLLDSVKFYIKSENFYDYLVSEGVLTSSTDGLFYSYWTNHNFFGMSNNRSKHPNITLITRVHGYDLYNERNENGRLPFRSSIDKNANRIIFVSQYGRNYYLKTHNKEPSKKYPLFKLGINNEFGISEYYERNYITLVSCSYVIPLKRVDLIVKALSLIDKNNISWVHFGDGKSFDDIENLAYDLLSNKENINYELKGHVDYQEIHKYYQENIVDCFITTSSTEGGTPVSIQEALSYGVPIIGTDVGGITEMIDGNGFLLSKTPTPNEITDTITRFFSMNYESYNSLRKKSRLIWEKGYNAEKNCKAFVDYIVKL